MKLKHTTILVTALGLSLTGVHAAAISWDLGADGSWQTAANWNPSTVPGSGDDITIDTGDTVTYTPGGDFTIDGGSLSISDGSTWTQAVSNWSRLNNGTMTIDNSIFARTGGGNLVLGFDSNNTFSVVATNSSINVGGEFWFGHNDAARTNQVLSVTLNKSTIDANGGVGIWFWDPDAAGNDFTLNVIGAGSTVEGRVGRRNSGGSSSSVTWETLWNEGILQANGNNSGTFSDHFVTTGSPGNTNYVLTTVPEPTAATLLGLGGLMLIVSRHRRN